MAINQSLYRRAYCKIFIDDGDGMRDVTDAFRPHLISVQVISKLAGPDVCNLELDDRDALLGIPQDETPCNVYLGWADTGPVVLPTPPTPPGSEFGFDPIKNQLPFQSGGIYPVFEGQVFSVESGFARRGGGRRLWIEAHSSGMKGDGKSVQKLAMGDGVTPVPFSDVMKKFGELTGHTVAMSGSIGDIKRPFWFASESFYNWGQRMGNELGAHFKVVSGNHAVMVEAGTGLNVNGDPMPNVSAEWGINLLSWRIKPYVARPQYASAKTTFFDALNGKWLSALKKIGGSVPFGNAAAIAQLPNPAGNSQAADQSNAGTAIGSIRERGTGWVMLNGEPACKAGGRITIIGARPGVDGLYFVKEAEHNWSRKGGFTTRCDVEQPDFRSGYGGWKIRNSDPPLLPLGDQGPTQSMVGRADPATTLARTPTPVPASPTTSPETLATLPPVPTSPPTTTP